MSGRGGAGREEHFHAGGRGGVGEREGLVERSKSVQG